MQRTETLLAALFLGIAFAPHSGATVYPSDGSEANVQSLATVASDGDVITLPAGTFIWTTGVSLTKGLTVSGQTTIADAGTANCTANDQTIIIDEISRSTGAPIFKATIPAGKSFRLTGVTFRWGSITQIGNSGAIRLTSTGLVQSARIDHCHFDHLYWGHTIELHNWIYGVEDHNLIECVGAGLSHVIQHDTWGGSDYGNGSWPIFLISARKNFGSLKIILLKDQAPLRPVA